jgi:hypothetical protein
LIFIGTFVWHRILTEVTTPELNENLIKLRNKKRTKSEMQNLLEYIIRRSLTKYKSMSEKNHIFIWQKNVKVYRTHVINVFVVLNWGLQPLFLFGKSFHCYFKLSILSILSWKSALYHFYGSVKAASREQFITWQ